MIAALAVPSGLKSEFSQPSACPAPRMSASVPTPTAAPLATCWAMKRAAAPAPFSARTIDAASASFAMLPGTGAASVASSPATAALGCSRAACASGATMGSPCFSISPSACSEALRPPMNPPTPASNPTAARPTGLVSPSAPPTASAASAAMVPVASPVAFGTAPCTAAPAMPGRSSGEERDALAASSAGGVGLGASQRGSIGVALLGPV